MKTPICWIDFADPLGTSKRIQHSFGAPVMQWAAHRPQDVATVINQAHARAVAGDWCVGYVRYEAANAFDSSLPTHPLANANNALDTTEPLAWFAAFDAALPLGELCNQAASIDPWQTQVNQAQFEQHIDRIHRDIEQGRYYQVNYTQTLHSQLQGHPWHWFAALHRAQPHGYGLYLDAGHEQILSVSPELFFHWQNGQLLSRPMKGTAPRGLSPKQDQAHAHALQTSAKEKAENVMIVDLIRNDMSRIATPFSVKVPHLFQLQALPTVWQMTSDVTATTQAHVQLADVFAALFPCGSVTGAPKISAMQAIAQLEPQPRGVYCGAVGIIQPGGASTFSVAIRTATVKQTAVQCGIGSGITIGATAAQEWQEWQHKQGFLERARQPFELLETLALVNGQLPNAHAHLQRMQAAAAHFGFRWNLAQAQACLDELASAHPTGHWRVRLLWHAQGKGQAQAFASEASPAHVVLQLATHCFESAHSEFVFYKTTRRAHYDAHAPQQTGVFDTVLWNAQGEITECTRGNIAACIDGQWITPPVQSGLLGGIGRQQALAQGRIQEGVIRLDDVRRATQWAFINSLRGWIDATVLATDLALWPKP